MKHNSNVPAFLTKLWTLVEDADTNEFICWSQEGNSFLVLDEQRFAKEILPKFFKHNNMASFIRQLNMYGFRKVMHIDTGVVKQERDGPVEFQHPYFKHGQDDLLENIKRKVSNARPEENKIRQEDLTKILASVQNVHSKQENIDSRLATLKRENEALWREISDLRQKHAHHQQLIKKLIHFIVTLVQNNHILNLKRKRPVLMNSNGKKPKYIHQMYDEKVCVEQSSVNSVKGPEISDDVIICDLTENDKEAPSEVTQGSPRAYEQSDVEIVEVELESCTVLPAETEVSTTCTADTKQTEADVSDNSQWSKPSHSSGLTSSGLTSSGLTSSGLTSSGLTSSGLTSSGLTSSGLTSSGLTSSGLTGSGLTSSGLTSSGLTSSGLTSSGLTSSGLTSSGLTSSGLTSSGLTSSGLTSSGLTSSGLTSSGLTSLMQLNKSSGLSLEDPVKMMDSILNENGAISQNINLLGKVELMDYLDSIDCSLEDFQAMLYGKQFGIDFDALEENVSSKEITAQLSRGRTEEDNADKQLIQYTSCPLLAFLDGCTSHPEVDLATGSSSTNSSNTHLQPSSSCDASVEAEPPSELLDTSLEPKQPSRSCLIRLEPLTEAEASEETLFYLCELSPAGVETDSIQLDKV